MAGSNSLMVINDMRKSGYNNLFTILALVFTVAGAEAIAQDSGSSTSTPDPKQVAPPRVSNTEEAKLQEQRGVLFQRMLEKPDDLDASFEYASLSIQLGDIEAAISTLERMRIFAPNLPRLQLELGLLYFQLSAYQTAKSYFEAAIAGDDVPQTVFEKVEHYLAAIEEATKQTSYSGLLRVGIRYQSNVNQAPKYATIVLNGLPFVLGDDSRATSDNSHFLAGKLDISRKLARQGVSMRYALSYNLSKQSTRDEFDFATAEASAGPLIDLVPGFWGQEDAKLKVYGAVADTRLDRYSYSTHLGAGAELTLKSDARTSGLVRAEYFGKSYQNSPAAPRAEDRDGSVIQLLTSWRRIVDVNRSYNAALELTRSSAEADYLSFAQYAVQLGHTYAFAPPFLSTGKWVLGTSLSLIQRNHDEADQFVNANAAQRDSEYSVRASLDIPLKRKLFLISEAGYRQTDSNYSTREFENLSAAISLMKVW